MRIVEINGCNFGSTGNIMLGIAEKARSHGHKVSICVPKSRENSKKKVRDQIFIGNRISRIIHLKLGRLTGYQDCFSILSTWNFLRKLSRISPDVIHLHNLHNCYINLGMLFQWIKRHDIPVVWTLHDCWSFTGQCPHFTMVKCGKWKTGCGKCPQFHNYPSSMVDRTSVMWRRKRKWFTGLSDMTIVTPSRWLAELVKDSYLGDYPVCVIHNGIDLSVFRPTESNFRQRYAIGEKKIILGVAFGWGVRKGLDVFIELAEKLDADRCQIVLVGTDDTVDRTLPENVISIHRTQDQKELAEIYTAADIFVNPTREDNYPTVNMEAIACGTPVITFNTGGSPEILGADTGFVTEQNNPAELLRIIRGFFSAGMDLKEKCENTAGTFDKNKRFEEYVKLFESKTLRKKTIRWLLCI